MKFNWKNHNAPVRDPDGQLSCLAVDGRRRAHHLPTAPAIGQTTLLKLRLFGAFGAKWSDGTPVRIRGSKQRALIALLATASDGVHTRRWLQDMLWSLSGPEHGRASLRRALSDLRRLFGAGFDHLFEATNIDIRLRLDRIELVGSHADGEFLEGIEIPENGFKSWLAEKRQPACEPTAAGAATETSNVLPAVAVIPFLARSGSRYERDFSDLMALEVTRSLSRSKTIDVISHLSSRQFDQRSLDISAVRTILGIDYLVYGTVSADEDTFQVDADFADAKTGRIHWTRTYRGSLADMLNEDQGVVAEIASQIGQTIVSASVELARSHPLPDVESHALFMSSVSLMHQRALSSFTRARIQIEELIRRAPGHSVLQACMGEWYYLYVAHGWSADPAADTAKAAECTKRALEINPKCAFSLAIDGLVQSNCKRDASLASSRFQDAIRIDPNNALAWLLHAQLHAFMGDGPNAVECANRACALSPIDPYRYLFDNLTATAHLANQDYENALLLADRSLAANGRHTPTLRIRTVALDFMGRHEEARESARQLLSLEPGLTVDGFLRNHPAADYATGRAWANALRRAGVPDR